MATADRMRVGRAYSVLYSFKGGTADGEYPQAGLLNVKDELYGTTCCGGANGDGTVFSITPSGVETVLHNFSSGSGDGADPVAGLINVKGTLYGSTSGGGTYCSPYTFCGVVFSITPSGTETVPHNFGSSGDGADPEADLVNVNGTFYGTTALGGANDYGTVFSITPSGAESVLYSFKGGMGDGEFPDAGLVNVKGTLYGTTQNGGGTNCDEKYGCGTVFSVTRSGTETMLYRFKAGSRDGAQPFANLINVSGTLYGTTLAGGASHDGTVFKISTSGAETVLYSFKGYPSDGEAPLAGLIDVNGKLYGTTSEGGAKCVQSRRGCGAVFALTTSGSETLLHKFRGGSGDGADPEASLVNVNGTLYGTTHSGGANNEGTVFSLSP
jgi:uncharacterized repeat protein (TIGR03803 family)